MHPGLYRHPALRVAVRYMDHEERVESDTPDKYWRLLRIERKNLLDYEYATFAQAVIAAKILSAV